jgi:hypothetical protein
MEAPKKLIEKVEKVEDKGGKGPEKVPLSGQGENLLTFGSLTLIGSLPEFSGIRGTLAVREFVGKILQAKTLVPSWDDSTALTIAKLKITGPAREFIAANEENSLYKSFDELSKALIKQYSIPEDISTLQVELSQMSQMANESVRAWGARIKGIGAKLLRVSGKMDTTFLQNLLKVRFEQGLRNPDFRRFIRWKDCATLDNAIEIAAQEEVRDQGAVRTPVFLMDRGQGMHKNMGGWNMGNHGRMERDQGHQHPQGKPSQFRHPNRPPVTCWRCGKPGHMSRECRTQPDTRSCFGCGQRGHIARECPVGRQRQVHRLSAHAQSFRSTEHNPKNGQNPSPLH